MRKSSIKSPWTIICIFVIIIRTVLGLTWVETKLQNCDLWCCQAEGGVLRGGEPGLLLYRLRKWEPPDPSSNPADWRPVWSEGPAVIMLSKPRAQPPNDPALVLRWDIQAELTYSLLWTLQRLPEKSLCQSPAITSRRWTPRSLPALPGMGWLCWTLSARPPKLTLADVLAHWLRFQSAASSDLTTARWSSHSCSPHSVGRETQTYGFMSHLWIQTACLPSQFRPLATKPYCLPTGCFWVCLLDFSKWHCLVSSWRSWPFPRPCPNHLHLHLSNSSTEQLVCLPPLVSKPQPQFLGEESHRDPLLDPQLACLVQFLEYTLVGLSFPKLRLSSLAMPSLSVATSCPRMARASGGWHPGLTANSLNQPRFPQISSAYRMLSQIIHLHHLFPSSAFLWPLASIFCFVSVERSSLHPWALRGAAHIWKRMALSRTSLKSPCQLSSSRWDLQRPPPQWVWAPCPLLATPASLTGVVQEHCPTDLPPANLRLRAGFPREPNRRQWAIMTFFIIKSFIEL